MSWVKLFWYSRCFFDNSYLLCWSAASIFEIKWFKILNCKFGIFFFFIMFFQTFFRYNRSILHNCQLFKINVFVLNWGFLFYFTIWFRVFILNFFFLLFFDFSPFNIVCIVFQTTLFTSLKIYLGLFLLFFIIFLLFRFHLFNFLLIRFMFFQFLKNLRRIIIISYNYLFINSNFILFS